MNLQKQLFHVWLIAMTTIGIANSTFAQQNVGIGTSSPHPSAILHLADSLGKGMLIPTTDTNAVIAYVNSLSPNPGIANGLLIYQKTDHVFYYYDGDLSKWVPLSGILGPTGAKGPTGPTGPRGPTGGFSTVRHGDGPPSLQATDKFGDYYFDTFSGRMWKMNITSTGWIPVSGPDPGRAIWRNQVQDGVSIHKSSLALQTDPMPTAVQTIVYDPINGLSADVNVGFDTIGYAMIRAYGTIRKVNPNNDYNFARFDFRIKGTIMEVEQDIGIGPNGPAPHNNFDQVSWQICYFTELTPGTNTIEVIGGQRFGKLGNGDIILADGPGSENQAHLDIFVLFRRLD